MAQPAPDTPALRADVEVPAASTTNSKKRVRSGILEIEERKQISAAKGQEQVHLVLTAYKKWKERVNLLLAKEQTWYHRSLKPVGGCIDLCYGGDVAKFVLAHPKLSISKYKCKCGTGSN
jgi:hypothetical protein